MVEYLKNKIQTDAFGGNETVIPPSIAEVRNKINEIIDEIAHLRGELKEATGDNVNKGREFGRVIDLERYDQISFFLSCRLDEFFEEMAERSGTKPIDWRNDGVCGNHHFIRSIARYFYLLGKEDNGGLGNETDRH